MQDLFYIVEVSPQWFNLLVKDTHYCIGCGSNLDTIEEVIYSYVRKFKTEQRVYDMLSGLSDNGTIAPATLEKRQKDYDSGKHLVFNDMIKDIVLRAISDNRRDTPYHRIKGKVKTTVTTHRSLPPTQNVERTTTKKSPIKVKKITVVKFN